MATHHHNEEIAAQQHRWESEVLEPTRKRYPERQERFVTSSDIPLPPVYTPLDSHGSAYLEQLGFPGQFPFTRGIYPTMYRGRPWTMRQYAGFGTAEASNQRYKFLLERGQKALSVAFDLPTQLGYDADHPLAAGEVGKVGVSITSLQDMATLFDGIPLDQVSTSMTINATAPILLALYIAVGKKQGVDPARLTGTVQNDILKEYVARGTYIYPPGPSMRLITDLFAYAATALPRWNTISISGYHMREAGATAVQEVAFTLANGIAYVEAALAAGLDVNRFGAQLSFFFNVHNHFLEEIAKFRAARRLWAWMMRERFHATEPRAQMLRFHAQTAGSTLTAQQPDNNIVRVAIQALAAVLGGAQSLHTNSRDEALSLPTEAAVEIALRTQQIIAAETNVTKVIDPVGGAYAIEALTDTIEAQARAYIEKIDDLGGAVKAVEIGFLQNAIQQSAYRYHQEVEERSRLIVGVNAYTRDDEPEPVLMRVDPAVERYQVERLRALRGQRDTGQVRAALARLEQAAKGRDNVMPFMIEAVECYATLGEIADTLRDVFGEHQEQIVLAS
jgi:methylmalonyl-CoA mutase N-terminal domain/subunit